MVKYSQSYFRLFILTLTLVASLTLNTYAEPAGPGEEHGDMDSHSMMGHPRYGHGMYPGGFREKGCRKGGFGMMPHNAAVHFLQMKEALKLNDKQITDLKGLRDSYRSENTVNEAKLKVAEEELRDLMFEDSINVEKAESKIKEIESLKGQLWQSFVRQLARIKAIVPKEQMKMLHEHRGHPMGYDRME